MIAPVPIVEFPDDAHALGVGRPDGEAHAGDPVDAAHLGAQFVVSAAVIAFVEQMQIGFAQRGQEGVAVAGAAAPALVVGDEEVVSIHLVGLPGDPFEQSALVDPLELQARPELFQRRNHFDLPGIVQVSAHHHPSPIAQRVHPQQLVWMTMLRCSGIARA